MCLAMFVAFITIGQIVFALGVSLKSWPVMFLGRVIYGFGGESLVLLLLLLLLLHVYNNNNYYYYFIYLFILGCWK